MIKKYFPSNNLSEYPNAVEPIEEQPISIDAEPGCGYTKIVINGIQIDTDKTVVPTNERQTIEPETGKYLKKVIVEPVVMLDTETLTPNDYTQTVESNLQTGEYLSKVVVKPVALQDKLGIDASPTSVVTVTRDPNYYIDTVTINKISEGSIAKPTVTMTKVEVKDESGNTQSIQYKITPNVEYSAGYIYEGTSTGNENIINASDLTIPSNPVKLTNASTTYNVTNYQEAKIEDSNLIASNIRLGTKVLGVTGTLKEYETPIGTYVITDTDTKDVSTYKNAKIVDDKLVGENIKSGVNILGISGTYKDIEEVSSVPSEKITKIIYNTDNKHYYVWKD